MEKVFNINNTKLYVYCEINNYCKRINNWLDIYEETKAKNYNLYIKIYKNKTLWNINGEEHKINGKLNHTDLYPLFYNVLANIINNSSNILLHSVVLCYNNIGILIVGEFNSGKTTLCLDALKNDMQILSSDQTYLQYKDNKIFLVKGSTYMKVDEDSDLYINTQKDYIEIKTILNLVGICDKGKIIFDLIKDNKYVIKTLFKYATWHSDIPLFTDKSLLNINRIDIYKWLSKINIPVYNIRGDSEKIIENIKEVLQ